MQLIFFPDKRIGLVISSEGAGSVCIKTALVVIADCAGASLENGQPDFFGLGLGNKGDQLFQLILQWCQDRQLVKPSFSQILLFTPP
jgi:hypothetical protein